MKKSIVLQTIGFTAEIIFFMLAGVFLAHKSWGNMAFSLIFAMLFAGYTGQLIKKQALEEKLK